MSSTDLLRDRWVGLFGLWTLQSPSKSLVILGEHHTSPNETTRRTVTESSDHAIYGLMEYLSAARRRDEKVTIYAELSMWNKQTLLDMKKYINPSTTTFIPKFLLIDRFYQELLKGSIPDDVTVNYCDIRHEPQFALMCMTHTPDAYVMSPALQIGFTNDEARAAFVKHYFSKFEKAFMQNIYNSEDTSAFWISLVLPEASLPQWYADIVKKLYPLYDTNTNGVKIALKSLKEEYLGDYNLLIEIYTNILEKTRTRQTVALTDYLDEMLTVIHDLYLCAHYIYYHNDARHHIFLITQEDGNHRFLTQFLSQKEQQTVYGWTAPDPATLEISTSASSTERS